MQGFGQVLAQVGTGAKLAGLGVLLIAPFVESLIANFGRPGVGERALFAAPQKSRARPMTGAVRG